MGTSEATPFEGRQQDACDTTTDLSREAVGEIVSELRQLLADVFALYLKTKNFHRHMSGRHFRDYHLLLDEQAGQIFAMTDDIAERVRKIGGGTIRSISDITRHQRLKDNNEASVSPLLSHLPLERGETPGSAGARFQQSRLGTLSFQARMSGQQLKCAAMWCKPIGKVRDMADQIKSHMLAAVVPAKGERWQLQEVPVLELLPTQVLVKVCASGISYADVEQTRGELPGHFPRIFGHEVAGDVVAVGDAVTADDCILTWSGTLRRHDARQ